MEIIVASGNKNKIREIGQMLSGKAEVRGMSDYGVNVEIEENGSTFLENALIKAKAVSEILGKPVIADDSGIVAEALGDAPGIYSARYAGEGKDDEENNKKLISELKGKSKRAYFISVIVLYYPDGSYIFGEGRAYGSVIDEKRGNNGFGYDPIFLSDDLKKTFGEASAEEKNGVSHRYRALCDLMSKL